MIEYVAAEPCDHDRKLIAADWYEERGDADTAAALRWLHRRGAAPCCFYYTPLREQDRGAKWAWVSDSYVANRYVQSIGGHVTLAVQACPWALLPDHFLRGVQGTPVLVWRFTTPLHAFQAVIRRYVALMEVLR